MAKKEENVRELKEYRVKWNGPAHAPANYAPDAKPKEREGALEDGTPFRVVFDHTCPPGGISRIFLGDNLIWSGYCWYAPEAIAKNPNIASFKITEV